MVVDVYKKGTTRHIQCAHGCSFGRAWFGCMQDVLSVGLQTSCSLAGDAWWQCSTLEGYQPWRGSYPRFDRVHCYNHMRRSQPHCPGFRMSHAAKGFHCYSEMCRASAETSLVGNFGNQELGQWLPVARLPLVVLLRLVLVHLHRPDGTTSRLVEGRLTTSSPRDATLMVQCRRTAKVCPIARCVDKSLASTAGHMYRMPHAMQTDAG